MAVEPATRVLGLDFLGPKEESPGKYKENHWPMHQFGVYQVNGVDEVEYRFIRTGDVDSNRESDFEVPGVNRGGTPNTFGGSLYTKEGGAEPNTGYNVHELVLERRCRRLATLLAHGYHSLLSD